MKLIIRLFAGARQRIGADHLTLEMPKGANVGEVRTALASGWPDLRRLAMVSRFAVNQRFADDETPVNEADEIALIPPVSGG